MAQEMAQSIPVMATQVSKFVQAIAFQKFVIQN